MVASLTEAPLGVSTVFANGILSLRSGIVSLPMKMSHARSTTDYRTTCESLKKERYFPGDQLLLIVSGMAQAARAPTMVSQLPPVGHPLTNFLNSGPSLRVP